MREVTAVTQRICSIGGCEKPRFAKTWCSMHFARWRRNGDPMLASRIVGDDVARFWSYVDKAGPAPQHRPDLGPCWLWTGSTQSRGYGQFNIDSGTIWLAHRYAWTLAGEELVDGLELDHLCRVPRCVRRSHLEQVTTQVNLARRDAYRRATTT